MCYHSQQTVDAQKLENRFKAHVKDSDQDKVTGIFNGFNFPRTPIITNLEPEIIQCYSWGLLPSNKDKSFPRNKTLNARIEGIFETESYRLITEQKCLILLDGFFEWQHLDKDGKLDPMGKITKKHLVTIPNNEPFAVAGLWSVWHGNDGEEIQSYTMIMTEAKGIMRDIHNKALRMPVVLQPEIEKDWLLGKTRAKLFTDLKAVPV